MKRIVCIFFLLLLTVSSVYAAEFVPTVMKLSASPAIKYDFDGSSLEFPVTVTGKQGSAFFLVFTRGLAEDIGPVQNGYLGWHYVNKIDTCVYLSSERNLDIGANTIEWSGLDNDGAQVPAGEYTYYVWAYDHVNAKIPACRVVSYSGVKGVHIEAYDESGNIATNPVLYPLDRISQKVDTDLPAELIRKKWTLGGDPADETLIETTKYMSGNNGGDIAIMPDNHDVFFDMMAFTYPAPGAYVVRKYEWIPNGEAVQDMSWGDGGEYQYNCELEWPHWESGVITDRQGMLYMTNQDISGTGLESELIYVDIETGEEIRRVDLSDWWVDLDDGAKDGQSGGGPTTIVYGDGVIFTSSHTSCIKQMLDPYLDDDDAVVKWTNGNGDYIGDHNYEEDSGRAWVCNDYSVGPYMYTTSSDANNFTVFNANAMGASTCGLIAPDGTGIKYISFAGETATTKYGQTILDTGSPFDGIYCDNASTASEDGDKGGIWYVSHDSITGIISSSPVAVDEAPAAFAVGQNSPNPFNPTTTIGFSIPDAGMVSIDVFNVAGQKVDTIVNDHMSAGSHSVNWNAAGFSAGVYFYTVKVGDFSKTMKMTLMK